MSHDNVHPARGIDHLVLCVKDLDEAARDYERLGFTLTPTAKHPWGTANRLVQLDGSFLELLTVASPEQIVEHGERRFSFGAWNRDWLAAREGFSMLVFEGRDNRADRDEFAAAGLADLEAFDFEREARLPDGSRRTVAFSLAFALSGLAPDAPMFSCHQHAPELFWRSEYQHHENGARCLLEAVMVAPDPVAMTPLFAALQGEEAVQQTPPGRLLVSTARGSVAVMSADDFEAWYGETVPEGAPAGAHFAAYRVGVDDLARVQALLAEGGVETRWSRAGLTLPAATLHGVALAFAQL